MLLWLAADETPRGSVVVDWLPTLVPAGVVVAAIIAAVVARWNVRKPPHEQLDTLVKLYRDWPEELEGKATIERQIALQLAEMRVSTGDVGQPDETAGEQAADERVLTRVRRVLISQSVGVGLAAGTLIVGVVVGTVTGGNTPTWFSVLGVVMTYVGGAIFFLSPKNLALYRHIRTVTTGAVRDVIAGRGREPD